MEFRFQIPWFMDRLKRQSRIGVQRRIEQGRVCTRILHTLMWIPSIYLDIKKLLYHSLFESITLYGAELWEMTKAQERRMKAAELNFWRTCIRKTVTDRVRTEDIQMAVSRHTTIKDRIEEKRLTWYGHVQRKEGHRISRQILQWIPRRRKSEDVLAEPGWMEEDRSLSILSGLIYATFHRLYHSSVERRIDIAVVKWKTLEQKEIRVVHRRIECNRRRCQRVASIGKVCKKEAQVDEKEDRRKYNDGKWLREREKEHLKDRSYARVVDGLRRNYPDVTVPNNSTITGLIAGFKKCGSALLDNDERDCRFQQYKPIATGKTHWRGVALFHRGDHEEVKVYHRLDHCSASSSSATDSAWDIRVNPHPAIPTGKAPCEADLNNFKGKIVPERVPIPGPLVSWCRVEFLGSSVGGALYLYMCRLTTPGASCCGFGAIFGRHTCYTSDITRIYSHWKRAKYISMYRLTTSSVSSSGPAVTSSYASPPPPYVIAIELRRFSDFSPSKFYRDLSVEQRNPEGAQVKNHIWENCPNPPPRRPDDLWKPVQDAWDPVTEMTSRFHAHSTARCDRDGRKMN
ncbi:hypothetical protein ANN_11635 [Periplaneta americana]|uniref:Uncharacterized protein n=1 Tax=Periplaneta americana TaxID=6978 RepID=A0ABQ8T5K8_PERAM|nr:hypothetical protein ANN_11635 [Periplaneta americana]